MTAMPYQNITVHLSAAPGNKRNGNSPAVIAWTNPTHGQVQQAYFGDENEGTIYLLLPLHLDFTEFSCNYLLSPDFDCISLEYESCGEKLAAELRTLRITLHYECNASN